MRPTSGNGCAGLPVSSSSTLIVPLRRWRLRFSKWQALGNVYLLTEAAGLTARQVRELVGDADGILEVTARGAAAADVVVWNPDGSRAELSGNGTRIAAAWLTERSGARDVE